MHYVKWKKVVSGGIYNNKILSYLRNVSFKICTITYSDIVRVTYNLTLLKRLKELLNSQVDHLFNDNDRNLKLTVLTYWYPVSIWQSYFISLNHLKYPVSMLNQNLCNLSSPLHTNHPRNYSISKIQGQRYGKYKFQNNSRNYGKNKNYEGEKVMSRTWEHVNSQSSKPGFVFSIMSYNVLAQELLEQHPHLYVQHNKKSLEWETRWNNFLTEIKRIYPDIICLQEVQESHINEYYSALESLGYTGVYKKRTGIRIDGCAIYFKEDNLRLIDHFHVEFFNPEIPVLNRDNVGIIAKLVPKNHPKREFVVATTHLLYNPRRNDVRLAQMQLFLAEIDRISYRKQFGTSSHIPVILTGDLNTQPNSDLYKLITTGEINYKHFLSDRWKLLSSESGNYPDVNLVQNQFDPETNSEKTFFTTSKDGLLTFSVERDCLTDHFAFRSVYNHGEGQRSEATTFQNEWVTVDYIFYSAWKKNYSEDKLKLLSRWKLPTKDKLDGLSIPNKQICSDHLSLLAKFKLEFR